MRTRNPPTMNGSPVKANVVAIDDDPDILEVIRMSLELQQHIVRTTRNKARLYDFVEEQTPDLFLVDININGEDGCKLCQDLKASPETSNIPVFIISGNANVKQLAKSCGAAGYLSKPFDMEALQVLVANVMKEVN